MNEPQPKLKIVDSNEPWTIREKLIEYGWQQQGLYSADYWFFSHSYKKIGIERKAVEDLLCSIGARLDKQLENMLAHYDESILLIEGSWRTVSNQVVTQQGISRWLMSGVWNYIRGWQRKGITLELTASENHTIRRLNELYAYYQKPYHSGGVNAHTFEDDRVLAFPSGCRGKTGMKVLEGKSIAQVASMTPEALERIDGIGSKKALSIYNHFNKVVGNDK